MQGEYSFPEVNWASTFFQTLLQEERKEKPIHVAANIIISLSYNVTVDLTQTSNGNCHYTVDNNSSSNKI